MGGRLAGAEPWVLRVAGIVKFVYLQSLFSTDNNQRLVNGKAQHFIGGENRALSHAAGFPKLRRIIGYAPSSQLFGPAGNGNACQPRPGADKFRRQFVGAAKEILDIAISQYFLPLVKRVTVLEASQVLEYTAHGDVTGAYHTDFSAEIWNDSARAQFFT